MCFGIVLPLDFKLRANSDLFRYRAGRGVIFVLFKIEGYGVVAIDPVVIDIERVLGANFGDIAMKLYVFGGARGDGERETDRQQSKPNAPHIFPTFPRHVGMPGSKE